MTTSHASRESRRAKPTPRLTPDISTVAGAGRTRFVAQDAAGDDLARHAKGVHDQRGQLHVRVRAQRAPEIRQSHDADL